MGTDVLDFGALDTAASAAETTVDTTVTEPVVNATVEEGAEKVTTPEELQTPEEKEAAKVAAEAKAPLSGSKIRDALKAYKAADPANVRVANELNNALGRSEALAKVFPGGVKEATEFKSFVDNMGGKEGIQSLHEQMAGVEETDKLLYSGDGPTLLKNIVEDLKNSGHPEALAKIAPAFLDTLAEHDPKGYAKAFAPHFAAGMEKAGVRDALNGLVTAFDKEDKAGMKAGLTQFVQWYNGVMKGAVPKEVAADSDPEREAFAKEKTEFETSKTKAFNSEVVAEGSKLANVSIVKAMTPMLQKPFFKGWPKETIQELGKDVRSAVNKHLANDKTYQDQLKVVVRTGDKGKITKFYNEAVASNAGTIAERIIRSRYPGYAKTPAKTTTDTTTTAKPVAGQRFENVKPIFVATKPAWEALDFTKDPNQVMYITGKGYLRNGKLVQWRK